MANIPLKTITFPELDDTYTVTQVDNTLKTAGAAADAAETGRQIGQLKADLENLETTEIYVRDTSLVINTNLVNGNEVSY